MLSITSYLYLHANSLTNPSVVHCELNRLCLSDSSISKLSVDVLIVLLFIAHSFCIFDIFSIEFTIKKTDKRIFHANWTRVFVATTVIIRTAW